MLVTLTPRLRVHQNEVICALVKGNSIVLRFVSMKPMRIPVDDLTDEARNWLLPSLAPREIPLLEEEVEYEEESAGMEETTGMEETAQEEARRTNGS